jgi:hypothetical protein
MQTKLPKNALRKGAIVGAISAAVILAATASLRFAPPSFAHDKNNIQVAQLVQPPSVNGDCNIIGNGNSVQGGINCPKFGPNPPKFEIGEQTIKPRNDGTFDLIVMTNLSSQTLVKLLYVSAEGDDVLGFEFEPGMSGVSSNWYGKMDDTGAKALGYSNPQSGPYILTIHTSQRPSPTSGIRIRYDVIPN